MKKVLSVILFLSLFVVVGKAQVPAKMKSLFIYNFTKYIEWPADYKTGDFIVAVISGDPLIEEVEKLAETKTVGTQKIVVKKIKSVAEFEKCNIIFLPTSKSSDLASLISKVGSASTLIVTEKDGLALSGAGINFVLVDNKAKFELNKANVSKQGLKISASLENLAIIVQ